MHTGDSVIFFSTAISIKMSFVTKKIFETAAPVNYVAGLGRGYEQIAV